MPFGRGLPLSFGTVARKDARAGAYMDVFKAFQKGKGKPRPNGIPNISKSKGCQLPLQLSVQLGPQLCIANFRQLISNLRSLFKLQILRMIQHLLFKLCQQLA